MNYVIPLKRRDATSLGELLDGEQFASKYLALPPGYIDGLAMEWVSGTALRVTSGSAYIEGLQRVVNLASAVTKSGLSLSASTWYHVYLYVSGSTVDAELSTTAPAAAYSGKAASRAGDTSRRYLGSVRTDGGAQIYNFLQLGNQIAYRNAQANAPFRVLAGGTATSITTVSCSAVVPVTGRLATLQLYNFAAGVNLGTGTSDDSAAGPPSAPNDAIFLVRADATALVSHPLASDTSLQYWLTGTPTGGGGAYIDVFGYIFER